MMTDIELLHVTDVPPEIVSDATMFGTWPIVIRDALREAGSRGLHRDAIVDLLACRLESGWVKHGPEIDNALDYLVQVGVARHERLRYFDIPNHPPRGGAA